MWAPNEFHFHYNDYIKSVMASQIPVVPFVCTTVCSGEDQRKHRSFTSLAFVKGILRWLVESPHKGPVTRKCFHLMTLSCLCTAIVLPFVSSGGGLCDSDFNQRSNCPKSAMVSPSPKSENCLWRRLSAEHNCHSTITCGFYVLRLWTWFASESLVSDCGEFPRHRDRWLLSYVSIWRHQMETFSALLALCAGNSPPVTGEFPTQRPVTRGFDVFFDLRLNKQLNKQPWGWWFEMLSRSLLHHCNDYQATTYNVSTE